MTRRLFPILLLGTVALGAGPAHGAWLSTIPAWEVDGSMPSAALGMSMANLGDINGDGHDDLIIGVPGEDGGHPSEGAAHIHLGSVAGLFTAPHWTAKGGQDHAFFGTSVAAAGDVDNDGYRDFIVGAPGWDGVAGANVGRVVLYRGGPFGPVPTPLWEVEGDVPEAGFGRAGGGAVDVDNDGYEDLLVGAPWAHAALEDSGEVFLYLAPDGVPADIASWSFSMDFPDDELGFSVASDGDVNGDGFDDFAVGAPGPVLASGEGGAILVFHGSASGPGPLPNWTRFGEPGGVDRLGHAVVTGDINGDGLTDVIVGEAGWGAPLPDAGRVQLYLGSATGLAPVPQWAVEGTEDGGQLGAALALPGSLDAGIQSEFVVGAPGLDGPLIDAGAVLVFEGLAGGLSTEAVLVRYGPEQNTEFGAAIAGARDVDDDGHEDLLVGAPFGSTDPGLRTRVRGARLGVLRPRRHGRRGRGRLLLRQHLPRRTEPERLRRPQRRGLPGRHRGLQRTGRRLRRPAGTGRGRRRRRRLAHLRGRLRRREHPDPPRHGRGLRRGRSEL